mmetsp:Transcript_42973/g.118842  ORF Transcript_42973/g.118842 Transcript_42973/m.118842 type:complete len:413 (-) Transcript_42973:30-1268(-)
MDNPLLKAVLVQYPDVDAASLPWPAGANSWGERDLQVFVGSGGFLKPKRSSTTAKDTSAAAKPADAGKPAERPHVEAQKAAEPQPQSLPAAGPEEVEERASGFEQPGFSKARHAVTMPVRVHCEDTTPNGHVRIESLVAFSERIRSLHLKQVLGQSLVELREREKLAILATEYVCEIVGKGCCVMDTLRIDTSVELPGAPLFPWVTNIFSESDDLYMRGVFALNLCSISDNGTYAGVDGARYKALAEDFRKWCHPDTSKQRFTPESLRLFNAYKSSGEAFKPTGRAQATYIVRAADCDLYNVLFQARVPSFLQSCHQRYDMMAAYVNILTSVRPGFELTVHVLYSEDAALFMCEHGKVTVVTAFAHYGSVWPISQEEIKCASVPGVRVKLSKFLRGEGEKPAACAELDLSQI